MRRTLPVFGDSNTHGTRPIVVPGQLERYDTEVRWPRVALATLGDGWQLVEEGLPGRTTRFDDPVRGGHMNAQPGLRIALESHGPIDVMTLMLGTNDAKARFGATPEAITAGIAGLLDIALGDEMQARHGGFKLLLICPPPVVETGPIEAEFFGASTVTSALPALYAELARRRGVGFLNAGSHIEVSQQDGIHLEPDAHKSLGLAIAAMVAEL